MTIEAESIVIKCEHDYIQVNYVTLDEYQTRGKRPRHSSYNQDHITANTVEKRLSMWATDATLAHPSLLNN